MKPRKSIWVYYKGHIDRRRDDQIRNCMGEDLWFGSGTTLKTFVRDHSFKVLDVAFAEAQARSLKAQGLIDSYKLLHT